MPKKYQTKIPMKKQIDYTRTWKELDTYEASQILPHLGKQMDDYSTCHRWFYAKEGHILSLHEDSQTLALLTGDIEDIDDAHFQLVQKVELDMHGAIVSYITRDALDVLEGESQTVKQVKAAVTMTQPETIEISPF